MLHVLMNTSLKILMSNQIFPLVTSSTTSAFVKKNFIYYLIVFDRVQGALYIR